MQPSPTSNLLLILKGPIPIILDPRTPLAPLQRNGPNISDGWWWLLIWLQGVNLLNRQKRNFRNVFCSRSSPTCLCTVHSRCSVSLRGSGKLSVRERMNMGRRSLGTRNWEGCRIQENSPTHKGRGTTPPLGGTVDKNLDGWKRDGPRWRQAFGPFQILIQRSPALRVF